MGDVLYIQTDKNRKITDPHVRLGDISDLTSNNPEVLQRCKVLRVLTLESGKYGRYAVSVMKLIELIQKKEKQVEVVHVGEPQFILTYFYLLQTKADRPACRSSLQQVRLTRLLS